MPQQLPEQAPNGSEPLAFSADVDAAIAQGARTVRFGDALAARGRTAVALDDAGRLTLYHPDGTTSLLP